MAFLLGGGANLGTAYGAIIIGTETSMRNINILGGALRASAANALDQGQDFFTAGLLVQSAAAAVGLGLREMISAGSSFEYQMDAVGAVLGVSTLPIMREIEEEALELGRVTSFTANEVGASMEELAKAGVSAENIVDGAAASTAALAAATGTDLTTSAMVMANAMNVFQISGEESARVADIIATAINESTATIQDFRGGLRTLGPVVANFGGSLEDTAAAIASFTNFGLRGADVGVSLARGLTLAARPTAEATALMDQLGITVFDAQGAFVGFPVLFENLRDSMGDLSDEQREAALSIIFGAEAADVMSLAVAHGADEYNRVRGEVDKTGTAAENASARLDNLRGDWEKLTGSLQSFFIESYRTVSPALRLIVQGLLAVADALGRLSPEMLRTLVITAAVGGAWLAAAGTMLLFGNRITAGIAAIRKLGFGLGLVSGPLGILIAALAALGVAYSLNIFGFRDAVNDVAESIYKPVERIAKAINPVIDALGFLWNTTSGAPNARRDAGYLSLLSASLMQLGFSAKFAGNVAEVLASIHQPMRLIRKNTKVAARGLVDFFEIVFDTGGETNKFWKRMEILFGADRAYQIVKWSYRARAAVESIREAITQPVKDTWDRAQKKYNKAVNSIRQGSRLLGQYIDQVLIPIIQTQLTKAAGYAVRGLSFLADNFDTIIGVAKELSAINIAIAAFDGLGRLLRGDVSGAVDVVLARFAILSSLIGRLSNWVLDVAAPQVRMWADDLVAWFVDTALPWTKNLVGEIVDWVLDVGVPTITGWVDTAINTASGIWDYIVSLYPAVQRIAGRVEDFVLETVAPTLTGWIRSGASNIWDLISSTFPTIRSAYGKIESWVLDVGVPTVTGAVSEAASDVWALVSSQFPGLKRLYGQIRGWTLDVAIPNITGAFSRVGDRLYPFLRDIKGYLSNTTGQVRDWALDVAIPEVRGAITSLKGRIGSALKSYVMTGSLIGEYNGDVPITLTTLIEATFSYYGELKEWANNASAKIAKYIGISDGGTVDVQIERILVTALAFSLLVDVGKLNKIIDDFFRGFSVTRELNEWKVILGDDPEVEFAPGAEPTLRQKAQQQIDGWREFEFAVQLVYIALQDIVARGFTAQNISDAIQAAFVVTMLGIGNTIDMLQLAIRVTLPAPSIAFRFTQTVNQIVRLGLEPLIPDSFDFSDIAYSIFIGAPKVVLTGVFMLTIRLISAIYEAVLNKVIDVTSLAWEAKFGIPSIVGFVWNDIFNAIWTKLTGLGDFEIEWPNSFGIGFELDGVKVPILSDIIEAVREALEPLGDIEVGWPNSFSIDFGVFKIGKTPSNTEVSSAVANALGKRPGAGGAGGELTMDMLVNLKVKGGETDSDATSGLGMVQTAIDSLATSSSFSKIETALSSISSSMGLTKLSFSTALSAMSTGVTTFANNTRAHVSRAATEFRSTLITGVTQASTQSATLIGQIESRMRSLAGTARTAGQSGGSSFKSGLLGELENANSRVGGIIIAIRGTMSSVSFGAYGAGYSAGQALGSGIVDGINSMAIAVYVAAKNLALIANSAFESTQKISSPSRVWEQYGRYLVQGLIGGMFGERTSLASAASAILGDPYAALSSATQMGSSMAQSVGAAAASTVQHVTYYIESISVKEAMDLVRWGEFVDGLPPSYATGGN